jgi:hypothetical protein
MSSLYDAYAQGHTAALQKFAATRGLKEIRKSMAGGDNARANRIAAAPGVFSPGAELMGSVAPGKANIGVGRGNEGLTTKVIHPAAAKNNLARNQPDAAPNAARKIHDKAGDVYSREVIQNKEQLRDVPGMPRILATGQTHTGAPVHVSEFREGTSFKEHDLKADPQLRASFQKSRAALRRNTRRRGFEPLDLRAGNALRAPDGSVNFVDAFPVRPHEVATPAEQRRRTGGRLFRPNELPISNAAQDRHFLQSKIERDLTPKELLGHNEGTRSKALPEPQRKEWKKEQETAANLRFTQHHLAQPGFVGPSFSPTAHALPQVRGAAKLREAQHALANDKTQLKAPAKPVSADDKTQLKAPSSSSSSPGRRPEDSLMDLL